MTLTKRDKLGETETVLPWYGHLYRDPVCMLWLGLIFITTLQLIESSIRPDILQKNELQEMQGILVNATLSGRHSSFIHYVVRTSDGDTLALWGLSHEGLYAELQKVTGQHITVLAQRDYSEYLDRGFRLWHVFHLEQDDNVLLDYADILPNRRHAKKIGLYAWASAFYAMLDCLFLGFAIVRCRKKIRMLSQGNMNNAGN